jgi:hypothetical protein
VVDATTRLSEICGDCSTALVHPEVDPAVGPRRIVIIVDSEVARLQFAEVRGVDLIPAAEWRDEEAQVLAAPPPIVFLAIDPILPASGGVEARL